MLWSADEFLLLLILLAGLLAAIEAGFRIGHRVSLRSNDADKTHVGLLQSAALGLLALLLGFAFFMAASRYDARKALVLEEANAIGTAYLRAGMLPAEPGRQARRLLREDAAARLAFFAAGIDPALLDKANAEAERLEAALWALALDAARDDPRSVSAGQFAEAVNAVIDVHEKRRVALDDHVPEAVLYLLVGLAAATLGLVGYACGLARRRRFGANLVFALLVVLVITTILDLDRPRRGLIEVSQASLVRLQASLQRDAR
mgnify:CR=1 FL=1